MTTITDHDKQALDFLAKTGATLKIQFSRHGKHFDDDKETRDIYTVTIERRQRSYTFDFGQSLAKSQYYLDNANGNKYTPSGKGLNTTKRVTSPSTHFFREYCKLIKGEKPTAHDILACLTKYNPGTFEDFCSEFGYDTDSRRAEKTYNAVKNEYLWVAMLFDEDEMEQLREIQ